MQSVSSRIWTRVTMSISYDNNHCTTGTSPLHHGHFPITPRALPIKWFYAISSSLVGDRVLPLCRDADSVFYSLSWMGSVIIHSVISSLKNCHFILFRFQNLTDKENRTKCFFFLFLTNQFCKQSKGTLLSMLERHSFDGLLCQQWDVIEWAYVQYDCYILYDLSKYMFCLLCWVFLVKHQNIQICLCHSFLYFRFSFFIKLKMLCCGQDYWGFCNIVTASHHQWPGYPIE